MDQKKVYNEFNGQAGSRAFWSGTCSAEKEHNKEVKWLSDLKEEIVKLEQQNLVINEDKVKKQCSKMPNWKAPGHDGV